MIKIHFKATSYTYFSQTLKVSGNTEQLGLWDVQKAFELYTDEKAFPEWTSKEPINAPEGIDIEFKLIVTDKENNLHHWEQLEQNRVYTTTIVSDVVQLKFEESVPEVTETNISLENKYDYSKLLTPFKIRQYKILAQNNGENNENPEEVDYAYKQNALQNNHSSSDNIPKQIRLKNELKQLSRFLPVKESNSIFLIFDEKRTDVMKALIFGSEDTPYAHGAFIFDILIPEQYPNVPPQVQIKSTKGGLIRFNPNLYADGYVCLSLLGTWSGTGGENWNPEYSNIYQILISLQSLIMDEGVYFKEPGYEYYEGNEEGNNNNDGYCNIVKYYNVQHTINDMIENPPKEFQEIIRKHFLLKKDKIISTVNDWVKLAREDQKSTYDDLVQYHNSQISTVFQENRESYPQMLEEEAKRMFILLDNLEQSETIQI